MSTKINDKDVDVEIEADRKDVKLKDSTNIDNIATVPRENGSIEKSSKILKSKSFTDSGPEEFHDIEIDPTNSDNKRIIFDIDENENLRESFKKKMADDGDDDNDGPKKPYQPGKMEKILNIMLCRKDLFKYGSRFDTILVLFGLLLAAICGICQPVFAILSGRLANTLLLMEIDDPAFLASGIQACILFVAIGAFLCVIAFIQFCCFNIACTRITRCIRNAYLLSILRQNPAWLEKNHSGALNTKLNDNIDRIYDGIGDKLGLLTRNMVQYIT
uniref:ABC transmembrane type-1 domain-containing protein n=1 Tax=Panagrolaimus sp. ES5 TaxID=591445 RepID=A0AC34GAK8_9BILA